MIEKGKRVMGEMGVQVVFMDGVRRRQDKGKERHVDSDDDTTVVVVARRAGKGAPGRLAVASWRRE